MKLTKYQKEGIVRSIMQDVPKPNRSQRHAEIQAAIVKLMSPECRKVYKNTPKALATHHVGNLTYDGCNWLTREVIVGDVSTDKLKALFKPYEAADEAFDRAYAQLSNAVMSCGTLAALKKLFPEFEQYFPTEQQPTKNLPALANVVADLTKLGWPKGVKNA